MNKIVIFLVHCEHDKQDLWFEDLRDALVTIELMAMTCPYDHSLHHVPTGHTNNPNTQGASNE